MPVVFEITHKPQPLLFYPIHSAIRLFNLRYLSCKNEKGPLNTILNKETRDRMLNPYNKNKHNALFTFSLFQ